MANQGLSGQNLSFGRDLVFKYVTNKDDVKKLREQFEWLIYSHRFTDLGWIESGGKYGYYMNRYSDNIGIEHIQQMVEYVKHNSDNQINLTIHISNDYLHYVKYVIDIIYSNIELFDRFDYQKFEYYLKDWNKVAINATSFYHGDFTIHNMLINGGEIVPIDPNFKGEKLWGSYLLDLSKMFQDVHLVNSEMYTKMIEHIKIVFPDVHLRFLHLLELTHYIRMIPYAFKHSEGLGTQKINKFIELADNLVLKIND